VDQTILALLEPHTARRWYDECLRVPVDLSVVSWLFTANDSTRLSSPLRDRLRIVHVDLPALDAFDAVLAIIILDIANEFEVDRRLLPALAQDTVTTLRRLWTRSRSPRRLRNAVLNLLSEVPRDSTQVRH
jgi:ATP-dependent Lon protease